MNDETLDLAKRVGELLAQQKATVTTAESCTGGGIAHALTAVAGCSRWFDCGFVTYSNASKQKLLGVEGHLIERFGVVSREVIEAMAAGACARAEAHFSVAVSGVAGPSGGSRDKPVGTVWFGWATNAGEKIAQRELFAGHRHQVREQAVRFALRGLIEMIAKNTCINKH